VSVFGHVGGKLILFPLFPIWLHYTQLAIIFHETLLVFFLFLFSFFIYFVLYKKIAAGVVDTGGTVYLCITYGACVACICPPPLSPPQMHEPYISPLPGDGRGGGAYIPPEFS
jgi:hypothetical protein